MSVTVLTKAFQRLSVFRKEIIVACHSTQAWDVKQINVTPVFLQVDKAPLKSSNNNVAFSPRSIDLSFDIPQSKLPLKKIIDYPLIPNLQIDNPIKGNVEKSDIVTNKVIETPGIDNVIEKHAVRMIRIRRKKMKKHKRKKWLKKFRAMLQKKEQRKRNQKEKAFQAELQATYQEALAFDAKQYVAERINILTKERIPIKWRGEVIPEAMIREFMRQKEEKKAHKIKLHTYRLKLD